VNDLPLAGLNVLVTRPAGQADKLCDAIEAAGGTAVRFPVVAIDARRADDIVADLSSLPAPDFMIFVSRNAVECGAVLLPSRKPMIAAVGRATADALVAAGIEVAIDPGKGFTSEHLLAHETLQDIDGKNVLIVRGDAGRPLLGDALRRRGARVDYLAVYHRRPLVPPAGEVERLMNRWRDGGIDCVSVLSAATLEFLIDLLPAEGVELLRQTPLVAPGERVIQTAGKLVPGIPAIQASGPLPEDIVSALVAWRHSGTNQ